MNQNATVFVHTPDGRGNWHNERRQFARVPSIGEHFVLSPEGDWYEVLAVVHCPFEGADFAAEAYALPVSQQAVIEARSQARASLHAQRGTRHAKG